MKLCFYLNMLCSLIFFPPILSEGSNMMFVNAKLTSTYEALSYCKDERCQVDHEKLSFYSQPLIYLCHQDL